MARASAFQAEGRGFEARLPLQVFLFGKPYCKPFFNVSNMVLDFVPNTIPNTFGRNGELLVTGTPFPRFTIRKRNHTPLVSYTPGDG